MRRSATAEVMAEIGARRQSHEQLCCRDQAARHRPPASVVTARRAGISSRSSAPAGRRVPSWALPAQAGKTKHPTAMSCLILCVDGPGPATDTLGPDGGFVADHHGNKGKRPPWRRPMPHVLRRVLVVPLTIAGDAP